MAKHLSFESIGRYLSHALPSQEQAAAADHLTGCEACRNLVAESPLLQQSFTSVRREIRIQDRLEPNHLEYEQLEAYVDNKIDDADREIVDSHVEQCGVCSDELQDLQKFRTAYHATNTQAEATNRGQDSDPENSIWWKLNHFWRFPGYVAAGTAIALIVVVVGVSTSRLERKPAPVVDTLSQAIPDGNVAASPSATTTPSITTMHVPLAPGLYTLSASSNRLDMPPDLPDLIGQRETLMGIAPEQAHIKLLGPVGTYVQTTRPTFHWQPLTGAGEYKVQVFDTRLHEVMAGPASSATSWKPEHSLQVGTVYLWQVTAVKGAETIVSPAPPAPPAKFKIIDQAQASQLDAMKRAQPEEHFSLGKAYAAAGLLDDAEREFGLVPTSDANRNLSLKFLHQIRTLRLLKQ